MFFINVILPILIIYSFAAYMIFKTSKELKNKNMKKLIIMRGWPGSGKSFLAKKISEQYINSSICSADHYHIINGEYKFNYKKIGDSHKYCFALASFIMSDSILEHREKCVVIIDNTNIKRSEYKPYLILADKLGFETEIRESEAPWKHDAQKCFEKCEHNVELKTITKMMNNFEKHE